MTTPIQIRNDDVVRDIRLLAEMTGKSITDVVAESVRIRLADAKRAKEAEVALMLERVRATLARIDALPIVGPLLTDDDFYDEDGMPK